MEDLVEDFTFNLQGDMYFNFCCYKIDSIVNNNPFPFLSKNEQNYQTLAPRIAPTSRGGKF